jgi:putative transposase
VGQAVLCRAQDLEKQVLGLTREHQLLAPHRRGGSPGPRVHDGSIIKSRVNDMWGTNMTAAFTTEEVQAALFFAVEHCFLEFVGIHAATRGTRVEALEPLTRGAGQCRRLPTSGGPRLDHST